MVTRASEAAGTQLLQQPETDRQPEAHQQAGARRQADRPTPAGLARAVAVALLEQVE
jgi:hypothetical protein